MSVLLAVSLADLAAPVGAAAASPSVAPATPALPTPGQVESTLPAMPAQPQLKSAPLATTPPTLTGQVPPGGPTVTVSGFDITGYSVFDNRTLQAQIAGYIGKDLTLAELYKVAEVLTRFYQAHGYGLARVTLPEQHLNQGHITLQVVEGNIGKISFDGNTRTRTSVLEKQSSAVKSGDVYTDAAMDRATLLLNDLPSLQAQAVLEPGNVFGTADLTYKVQEDAEYSGQISLDDYGRSDIGRWRVNGEVDVASLSGYGDKLTADVTHTESNELNFGALSYSLPLGPAGGRFNASYNQSEYSVGKLFTPLGLSGSSRNGNLSYQYPEIRSHSDSLFWGLGFEHEGGDSFTDPESGKPSKTTKKSATTESNLNLLQLTGYYTGAQDDGANYSLNGTFASNGRRDDGTTNNAERARLELDAAYVKPFATVWSFLVKADGEWSPDPLADTEKYSLGGPDNVRGFASADVRGDSAVFGSLELQRSFAPDWPIALGAYLDAGKAWSKEFSSLPLGCKPNPDAKPPVTCDVDGDAVGISSVGTELIFESPGKRWESRLEWAYAVGRKPSDGNSGGHIWATFGMNF